MDRANAVSTDGRDLHAQRQRSEPGDIAPWPHCVALGSLEIRSGKWTRSTHARSDASHDLRSVGEARRPVAGELGTAIDAFLPRETRIDAVLRADELQSRVLGRVRVACADLPHGPMAVAGIPRTAT